MSDLRQDRKQIARRSAVSPREKSVMLSVLIRNQEVFDAFKGVLAAEHFGELDVGYGLVWKIVSDFVDEHGELPDRELLMTEVESALDSDPNLLHQNEIDDLEGFIDGAFDRDTWKGVNIAKSKKHARWATHIAQCFMEEQIVAKLQDTIKSKGRVASDIPALLEGTQSEIDRIREVDIVDAPADNNFFPSGWDKEAGLVMRPTLLPFIDPFLGGGDAAGEAYGLMGPFGSCKTTIANMMMVRGAYWAAENQVEGHGYTVLVSFETRMPELRQRALSYAGMIRRKSIERMGMQGLNYLSTELNLRNYEKKLFEHDLLNDKRVGGERERASRAVKFLNQHTIPIDLTGYDKRWKAFGSGYIEEIARLISRELRKRGKSAYVVRVIIDYVGIMARNHMARIGKDESYLRHFISAAPSRGRRAIAEEFGCPLWLIHQLSGEANKKSPGARYHHTDAAEARNFGENLDFCLIISSLNDLGLGHISCTKHRRFGHRPPQIIQVEGELNRVIPCSDKYVIDPYSHTIKEREIVTAAGSKTKKVKTSFEAPEPVAQGSEWSDMV